MRAHRVFAGMTPEQACELFGELRDKSPAAFSQALALASVSQKARPAYMARQPFERQAEAARRALARVAASDAAEEMLATYFLECRRELLVEWLDAVELPNEDGILEEERPPSPPRQRLEAALRAFRKADDADERELLLRAFAAQRAIDWPDLEALIAWR